MKLILLAVNILAFSINIFSQDIDLYHKNKNDNYNMPQIPYGMPYKEFELLSEKTRMLDMMYAMVVPGYLHFKAYDNTTGYTLAGVRTVAFGVMSYVYFKEDGINDSPFGYDSDYTNNDEVVFNIALSVAIATYLYDWIHGDYLLRKKQEKIRYKYAPRIKMAFSTYKPQNYYPALYMEIKL